MRDDWIETTLGSVALLNPLEPSLNETDHFAPMDAVHVGKRWLQYTEEKRDRNGARARAGDILFARITPCLENGKVAQVQSGIERCGGSTEFIVIRGTEKCTSDFLYFWCTLKLNRDRASELMTGTTGRQRLSWQDLGSLVLSLPPLHEQKRIVDLISSVDSYIESLQQQLESAKKSRNAVLHKLLTAGGEDWLETTLGEIANWGSGGTPKADNPDFYDGEIPWCVIGDLTESEVWDTEKRITQEGLANSSAKVIDPGSVLLAMYGASIGKTGISALPMATNQAIAFARCNTELILPKYLLGYLQTQKMKFVEMGHGAAQPNISQTIIKSWPVSLPPISYQEQLVSIIDFFDAALFSVQSSIQSSRILRSSLLSDLLSGEHVIPESYDRVIGAA
jgi:type I restriction enzyme S subunit